MNISRFGCAAAAVAMSVVIAAAQNTPARGGTPASPAPARGTAAGPQAPRLEVDALWPQPFPVEKHWALGSVTGVVVDSQDHIW